MSGSFALVMFFILTFGLIMTIAMCAALAGRLAEAEAKHDELAGDYPSPAARFGAMSRQTDDLKKKLYQLANATQQRFEGLEAHVTGEELPSTARHAHTGEMDAVTEVIRLEAA